MIQIYNAELVYSITYLGYSLHTRKACFQILAGQWKNRWYHSPVNVDNANEHKYEVLGPTASKTLEILLTFYNSYYILRLSNSYIW